MAGIHTGSKIFCETTLILPQNFLFVLFLVFLSDCCVQLFFTVGGHGCAKECGPSLFLLKHGGTRCALIFLLYGCSAVFSLSGFG